MHPHVEGYVTGLLPSILDNAPRLDRRHGERFNLNLDITGLHDGAIEYGIFLEVGNRAVGLDGASGYVRDLAAAAIWNVDLAMGLLTAFGEYLDAQVVTLHRADVVTIYLILNPHLP